MAVEFHWSGGVRSVAPSLACVSCGYNLRGLSRGGRCPECGFEVRRSTVQSRFNLPRHLHKSASGVVVLSILASLLSGAAAVATVSAIAASRATRGDAWLVVAAVLGLLTVVEFIRELRLHSLQNRWRSVRDDPTPWRVWAALIGYLILMVACCFTYADPRADMVLVISWVGVTLLTISAARFIRLYDRLELLGTGVSIQSKSKGAATLGRNRAIIEAVIFGALSIAHVAPFFGDLLMVVAVLAMFAWVTMWLGGLILEMALLLQIAGVKRLAG